MFNISLFDFANIHICIHSRATLSSKKYKISIFRAMLQKQQNDCESTTCAVISSYSDTFFSHSSRAHNSKPSITIFHEATSMKVLTPFIFSFWHVLITISHFALFTATKEYDFFTAIRPMSSLSRPAFFIRKPTMSALLILSFLPLPR